MWDFDESGNLFFTDELGNTYTPSELGINPGEFVITPGESDDDAGLIGYSWGDVKDYKDLSKEDLTKRLEDAFKAAGTTLSSADQKSWIDKIVKAAQTPAGLATLGTGIYALMGGNEPKVGGYQGTVPQKTLVREQLAQPAYQPYTGQATMGRRFFTDAQYVNPSGAEAARTAAKEQAAAYKAPLAPPAAQSPLATAKQTDKYNPLLSAQNLIASEKQKGFGTTGPSYEIMTSQRPYTGPTEITQKSIGSTEDMLNLFNKQNNTTQIPVLATQEQSIPENLVQSMPNTINAYQGGIMGLAKGRYLRGSTDGMADEIPSSIDGKQPAALSHGEFVIPADVVSHLGNGNSDAGADQLYKMMDRIRKARTGNKEQGKRINPESFMPGGMAKYASGGIASFQTGGTTDSALSRTASSSPYGATQSATLAPWASGYVTDYLSKAQALASEPYQAYQGPLTAGVSPLQQQAYEAEIGRAHV